jgi:O-antigen/teichoic acid export membrane protein
MQGRFLANLILFVLVNLLVKPISLFAVDAGFQNTLGHEEYGVYFSLLNFSILFNILLDFGINNFTTRRVAQQPEKSKKLFGTVFIFRLLLFILYLLVLVVSGLLIGYDDRAISILFLLGINQFIILSIAYFRSHFAGFHYFRLDALLSVLDRFLLIIFGCYFLYFFEGSLHIETFVWIQFFTYFVSFLISYILFIRYIDSPVFNINFSLSLAILKRSIPYAILIVLMLIYSRIDSVLLERLHHQGAEQAGIYAQGYRLLDAFYMFGMIFAGLLYPMFSRYLSENKAAIYPLLRSAGDLLIGSAILIAIICVYNSSLFLSFIYEDYHEAIYPFHWLIISFIAICMNFIFGTLLTASGNLKVLNWISFLGILLNIVLNLLLIPKYGALGAAFTTFVTQFFTAILQCVYAIKLFQIPVQIGHWIKYPLLITVLLVLSEFLRDTTILLLTQVTIGSIGMFVLSFISWAAIKEMINEKANKIN